MQIGVAVLLICFFSAIGSAQDAQSALVPTDQGPITTTTPASASPTAPPQTPPPNTPYTRAYEVRQNIHKYASYATLPLFATEFALGEALDNEPGSSESGGGLHAAVGTGLVGLFFVNTVTGGWNLWQSRHEKDHRTPRVIHSLLMIAANAGFVATAASAPSKHNPATFDHDRNAHRNMAIASIGIGTAGYLLAVFGRH